MPHTRTPHRPRAIIVAISMVLALTAPCPAAVLYVNQNAPGPPHDGATWTTALATVQQGITAASAGDEVWVAAATYKENITLKSGVALYGGFIGTETGRSQRDYAHNSTILDGQSKGTVVTIAANATSDTVLDGFTIQNGYGLIVGDWGRGGGVYITSGTPIVSNNVITSCYTQQARYTGSLGGGIYIDSGTPLITGNTITNNFAMIGGGVYASGGLIRDNYIGFNVASHSTLVYGRGGGILLNNAVAIHNMIVGNVDPDPSGAGGGISCWSGVVIDNLFNENDGLHSAALQCVGNTTVMRNTITSVSGTYPFSIVDFGGGTLSNNFILLQTYGAALTLGASSPGNSDGTEPHISNNTIINTAAQTNGSYAVVSWYRNGEKPVVSNNIVYGWRYAGTTANPSSTPPAFTTEHNDIYGNTDNTLALPGASQVGTDGNISQDPLFMDPANGDYRLQAGSPCIDAGNDAYVKSGDRDAGGSPRIYGAHVDIGAYEYGSPLYTMQDAAEVLRIAAGISIGTPVNIARLDVVPQSPGLTILDATRIAQWLLN